MIPKIIHYCWLSNDPFPEVVKKCIDSWEKVLPDYKIIKWDLNRFDINSIPYVREAYRLKKYAFCADYIRIYALYTIGGIYLDSDVFVYKSLNPFLIHKSFTSIEFHYYLLYSHIIKKKERMVGIEAAVIGSEKGCAWQRDILEYFNNQKFSMKKSALKRNLMPKIIAKVLHEKYGFKYFPCFQQLKDDFVIYPAEIFSFNYMNENPIKYSAHLGANSWGGVESRIRVKLRSLLIKANALRLIRRIRKIEKFD